MSKKPSEILFEMQKEIFRKLEEIVVANGATANGLAILLAQDPDPVLKLSSMIMSALTTQRLIDKGILENVLGEVPEGADMDAILQEFCDTFELHQEIRGNQVNFN